MVASFGHGGDGKVSASEMPGLCVRDASEEDASTLVASAANTDGDDGLLDDDELAGQQAEASGEQEEEEEEDGELRWLREAFGMYEMEGAGCITPLSLKLVLARLGAHRDIADCQAIICRFDMDGDGVLSFDEFRTMMMG